MRRFKLFALVAAMIILFSADIEARSVIDHIELKDGTKIEIDDKKVFIINAAGEKMPAPDGAHELKDGGTIITKDGRVIR